VSKNPRQFQNEDVQLRQQLCDKLSQKKLSSVGVYHFRNAELAQICTSGLNTSTLSKAIELLQTKGTLQINTEEHLWKDLDGEVRSILLARAASTEMWPMGTHCWIRDNAYIANRLLNSGFLGHREQGKTLLLSMLTLISSTTQRKRLEALIQRGRNLPPGEWPHIFLSIADNLNASKNEKWMHVQDAWQILGYFSLQALSDGHLQFSELSAKHRKFFSLLVPALAAYEFATHENAGSWEEFCAVRSSVICWETALLSLLSEHETTPLFQDMDAGFKKWKQQLPLRFRTLDLQEAISLLLKEGKNTLQTSLPFESPLYPPTDPKFRKLDAALIAPLLLDLPKFLDAEQGKTIEEEIYGECRALMDPLTGGISRYLEDSYQRLGFFRPSVIQTLTDYYGGQSGEASSMKDFLTRNELVPQGRIAAWSHFRWQLCTWAAKKARLSGTEQDKLRLVDLLMQALSLVTGENEWTIEVDADAQAHLKPLPAFLLPECYISESAPNGKDLIFPSPHTPLNWAVAEAIAALAETMREVF
jgi:hypothetical protein